MTPQNMSVIISTYDDIKNPHYGGGGAIAIHELAKRLGKTFDLTVISWNHSGVKHETIDGVHYHRIGIPALPPIMGMLIFQVSLPFLALLKQYDLWFESFGPPFTTACLPLFARKRVVGVVHMLAAEDMERKYKLPFRVAEYIGIKLYKQIIVTNDYIKEKVISINKNAQVTVISNGIEKVYDAAPNRTKTILFLGRVEVNQKGLDLLIKAFKQFVTDGYDDYYLVIAGSGSAGELKKLNRLFAIHDLSDRVVCKGWVHGDRKIKLLREATAVVIPSRFETFSMVALEAMACGVPVVCFDISGLKWVPLAGAIKVPPFNIALFAQALKTLSGDTETVNELRTFGPEYAKDFTWDTIAKQYEEFIHNLESIAKTTRGM